MAASGRTISVAGFASAILAALSLIAAPHAFAQPQPAAGDVQASQISPSVGPAAAADQIAQSQGVAPQTEPASPSPVRQVAADQLSATMATAEAPPALSSRAQGRDPRVQAIHGHDRCDPAAASTADKPACANILDQKADQFTPPQTETAQTANPDAPASALVNDIVNGGTGTVVIAPLNGK